MWFRRSDVAAEAVYLLVALLTHQVLAGARHPAADGVLGHARHARSLMDDDLLASALSMFSGGPRNRCCKQLTLCDLATTLLQAVEANKAQDVDTLRRRKEQPQQHDWQPFRGFSARFRRAELDAAPEDAPEDAPPNPVLVSIARTYMSRLRQDEADRREAALRRAQDTLDRERAAAAAVLHDDDLGDEQDGEAEPALGRDDGDTSSAIQKISPQM